MTLQNSHRGTFFTIYFFQPTFEVLTSRWDNSVTRGAILQASQAVPRINYFIILLHKRLALTDKVETATDMNNNKIYENYCN